MNVIDAFFLKKYTTFAQNLKQTNDENKVFRSDVDWFNHSELLR